MDDKLFNQQMTDRIEDELQHLETLAWYREIEHITPGGAHVVRDTLFSDGNLNMQEGEVATATLTPTGELIVALAALLTGYEILLRQAAATVQIASADRRRLNSLFIPNR